MKFYNSLTNNIEEFKPINDGCINMYVCGPTVNKRTHLGHMYPAVFFDTVCRYFRYLGYKVTYASNFTDVDDKIIASALEEGVAEKVIADRYAALYEQDLKNLNCVPVDYRPRVTEYIDDIIKFIELLLEKGYAYKKGNDICFNVKKLDTYGVLSNQKIEDLEYGNRVDISDDKENPYDFVLWKLTKDGIKWETPFGTGRPGWHTECVVMINKIFNGKIDIHGGGIDLKFPHHENEIAQSQAAWNHTLASYWIHNGHLMMNGVKMSKSLGNVLTVDELLEKYTSNTIRISILKNQYRIPLYLSDELFEDSKTIDDKLINVLKQANLFIKSNNIETGKITRDEELEKYMDSDLNTSNTVTYLLELVKNLNSSIRNKDIEKVSEYYDKINLINNIFGLKFNVKELDNKDMELYNNWNKERENKNFEEADKIRQQLIDLNVL